MNPGKLGSEHPFMNPARFILICVFAFTGSLATLWSDSSPPATWTNSLEMVFIDMGSIKVSIYETRVDQYAAYKQEVPINTASPLKIKWKPQAWQQTDHPAIEVTWLDATDFCAWLTKKERAAGVIKANQRYRLPTDFEWSKMASIDEDPAESAEQRSENKNKYSERRYYWGSEWPPSSPKGNFPQARLLILSQATGRITHAEYRKPPHAIPIGPAADGYENTSPVGSFPANRLGLFDIGGNAAELCEDSIGHPPEQLHVVRDLSFQWLMDKKDYAMFDFQFSPRTRRPDVEYAPQTDVGFRVVLATDGN